MLSESRVVEHFFNLKVAISSKICLYKSQATTFDEKLWLSGWFSYKQCTLVGCLSQNRPIQSGALHKSPFTGHPLYAKNRSAYPIPDFTSKWSFSSHLQPSCALPLLHPSPNSSPLPAGSEVFQSNFCYQLAINLSTKNVFHPTALGPSPSSRSRPFSASSAGFLCNVNDFWHLDLASQKDSAISEADGAYSAQACYWCCYSMRQMTKIQYSIPPQNL